MAGHEHESSRAERAREFLRTSPDCAALEQAIAWIDAHGSPLEAEEICVHEAAGRMVAAPVESAWPLPPAECATADGFAVRSCDTVGAGDYNPLLLTLCAPGDELPPLCAAPIVAGAALPRGADAVLPFGLALANGPGLEVFGAVPRGLSIVRQGQQLPSGTSLVERGGLLLPQEIGLLATLGHERVSVVRQPRVRLLVCPPKSCEQGLPDAALSQAQLRDANSSMLQALVARDGGVVIETALLEAPSKDGGSPQSLRGALAHAMTSSEAADLTLVAGRSGNGWDDVAAQAIADCGELAMHGIAMRPGGSAGMGVVNSAPVMLLPGDPLDCLCAYDMLAGRLIRRLGGRSPELPYVKRKAEAGRKFSSAIGLVEVFRVRLENGKAEPVASVGSGGLASAVRADGFVFVPASSEGFAPGTQVDVFLYRGSGWQARPRTIGFESNSF